MSIHLIILLKNNRLFVTIYLPLDISIRGKEIFANFCVLVDCLFIDGDLPGERLRGDFLSDEYLVGLFLLLLLALVVLLDGLFI